MLDARIPAPPSRARLPDAVLGVALAAGVVALALGEGWHESLGAACLGVVAAALAAPALCRIDVAEHRLPNALTVPLLAIGLVCAALAAARGAWLGVALALVVALLLGSLWWFGGMGAGDLKLGTALALATAPVAWWLPLAGLAAAFVLGGAAGLVARAGGARAVPFGPWLLAGTGVALVLAAA